MFKKCGIRDKRYFQKASAINKNVHVHVAAYNRYIQANYESTAKPARFSVWIYMEITFIACICTHTHT